MTRRRTGRRWSPPLLVAGPFALGVTSAAWGQAAVPSPSQFLGYEMGATSTITDRLDAYYQELARQSPDGAGSRNVGTP